MKTLICLLAITLICGCASQRYERTTWRTNDNDYPLASVGDTNGNMQAVPVETITARSYVFFGKASAATLDVSVVKGATGTAGYEQRGLAGSGFNKESKDSVADIVTAGGKAGASVISAGASDAATNVIDGLRGTEQ